MKGAYIWKHIAAYEARDTADEHWALGRAMTHVSTMSQCTAWPMTLWNQIWWASFSDYLTFMNVLLFMDGNKANKDPKRLWGEGTTESSASILNIFLSLVSLLSSYTTLLTNTWLEQTCNFLFAPLLFCKATYVRGDICCLWGEKQEFSTWVE